MLRNEAVRQIKYWADEAEDGNYHQFSAVLREYARVIKNKNGNEILIVCKSIDEFPIRKNIVELIIED